MLNNINSINFNLWNFDTSPILQSTECNWPRFQVPADELMPSIWLKPPCKVVFVTVYYPFNSLLNHINSINFNLWNFDTSPILQSTECNWHRFQVHADELMPSIWLKHLCKVFFVTVYHPLNSLLNNINSINFNVKFCHKPHFAIYRMQLANVLSFCRRVNAINMVEAPM